MKSNIDYLTNSYDEKIKKINEFDAPFNFVFFTDAHNRFMSDIHIAEYERQKKEGYEGEYRYNHIVNAINSIEYIIERCKNIRLVVSGGDMGNDYLDDAYEIRKSHKEVMDAMYKLSVPVHSIIGNHDDGLANCIDRGNDTKRNVILPDEMHSIYMKNNPTDKNYYYIDEDGENYSYRLVFLNTSDILYARDDGGDFEYVWGMQISAQQASWFENEALCTDRKIIVFSHCPVHNEGMFGACGDSPCGVTPYDDVFNAPRIYYDIKKSENVVMMVSGHVHYDNLLYDNDILFVTTLCALAQGCEERKTGTETETAFDVFSIKDDKVQITRFGAGKDRFGYLLKNK